MSDAQPEHKAVERLVAEAQRMDMASDDVAGKVRKPRGAAVHSATEEEGDMLPLTEAATSCQR